MKDRYFQEEEHFHDRDRKLHRKERKSAQEGDRSKFKKTDQKKESGSSSPDQTHLPRGQVTAITGESIQVNIEGKNVFCTLKGQLKKEKRQRKNLLAVGDFVRIEPISSSHGVISSIEERYSFLSRVDISGKQEQLLAVNIDQVLIISSLLHPALKPALIDRYLIATEKGNMQPIILVNKTDLLKAASQKEREFYKEFLDAYERIGYPILSVSALDHTGIQSLCSFMKNKTSVFSGQSGVGKSSLLNAAFGFQLKTGELIQKTSKGAHTTSSATLLPLPNGGFCIDTPGIRSFGVWKLERSDLLSHFKEFLPFAANCRYPNCSHRMEPDCNIQTALQTQQISPIRFTSYLTLLEEIEGIDHRTKRKKESP